MSPPLRRSSASSRTWTRRCGRSRSCGRTGYHDLTVYTPVPVHEIEDVLERDRPVSRVRLFTLIGGLTGHRCPRFLLTIWTSMVWGQVTGGKFLQLAPGGIIGSSLPPFFIIAFEMMVLFGGLRDRHRHGRARPAAALHGRAPSYDPRFTNDRFGVAVHCAPERAASVHELLRTAGAEEVKSR